MKRPLCEALRKKLASLRQETLAYLEAARQKGMPIWNIQPEELHLLMTAYTSALFDVVVHDFSWEEAAHFLHALETFFTLSGELSWGCNKPSIFSKKLVITN